MIKNSMSPDHEVDINQKGRVYFKMGLQRYSILSHFLMKY